MRFHWRLDVCTPDAHFRLLLFLHRPSLSARLRFPKDADKGIYGMLKWYLTCQFWQAE
jgi:hypothetical protein